MAETIVDAKPAQDAGPLYLYAADRFATEISDVRVHAVALTNWLNSTFLLREGMPVPVLFAAPMDAFAQFNRLWKEPNNPFSYLNELTRSKGATGSSVGTSLTPAQLRFPLLSIDWRKMRYRPEQSYASRVNRRVYWPTVNDVSQGLTLSDLANVAQARMAAAWTFSYQVDFWCARPDTQAIYIKQLTNALKVMSAGTPQTFIPVVYPGYYGAVAERLVLASDIDDLTEKEPAETEMRYRTSILLDIEGYAVDQNITVVPTVWTLAAGSAAVSPSSLKVLFNASGVNLRTPPVINPVIVDRMASLPPEA